jgi:response regulator RpfG family c-di-GMP phosphodiesterase
MKEELSIIRSHHEKWNGEGYPDRLKGEQIPLVGSYRRSSGCV